MVVLEEEIAGLKKLIVDQEEKRKAERKEDHEWQYSFQSLLLQTLQGQQPVGSRVARLPEVQELGPMLSHATSPGAAPMQEELLQGQQSKIKNEGD